MVRIDFQHEPGARRCLGPQHVCPALVVRDESSERRIIHALVRRQRLFLFAPPFQYLRKAGHAATLVADGEAAVHALEAQPFDAVLMDINMPKLDGIGATRAIRRLARPRALTPIIALTANTMAGEREALLAAGMDAYLAKPIDQGQLLTALAKVSPCPA